MYRQPSQFSLACMLLITALALNPLPSMALEPAAIDWGKLDIIPTLRIEQRYDSNIYLQKDNPIASGISTISPEVTFQIEERLNNYRLTLFSDYGKYQKQTSGTDDFFDYGLLSSTHLEFNDRNVLDIYGDIRWMHDNRGNSFDTSDPFSTPEPDEYTDERLGASYRFGLLDHTYLKTEIFTYKRHYQNNQQTKQSDPRVRDHRQNEIQITLNIPISTQLAWFAEVDAANYAYYRSNPFSTITILDSEELRGFIGLSWQPQEKLSAYGKLGKARKTFDDKSFKHLTTNVWDFNLAYQPTDVDHLYFFGRSRFRETETSGSAVKARTYGMRWQHFWLERLDTSLSYDNTIAHHTQVLKDNLEDRRDISDTVALSSTYRFRRWLDVSLLLQHKIRRSNRESLRYKQNIISLAIDLSL